MDKEQDKKSGNMFTKLKETFLRTIGVKENDTPAKPEKVTLIVGRHDHAPHNYLSGYGAAYAFLLGKLLCDYCQTSYPEHIFYSPVSRARETALQHKLAMKVNDITPPTMSYDAGFHEQASMQKVQQSLSDALIYAEAEGMQTVEIIGHEPTVKCISGLLNVPANNIGYGGVMVIKADSWQDLRQGKGEATVFSSSRDFALEALGEVQVALIDKFTHYGQPNYSNEIKLDDIPVLMSSQQRKAERWAEQLISMDKPAEKYSPLEFLSALDAYRYFCANQMAVVGIAPREDGPFMSGIQQKLFGDSYFMDDFIERIEGKKEEENETYSVFNAVAAMIAKRKGIDLDNEENLDPMEEFPTYRKIIHAGEDRVLEGDKEVAKSTTGSYQVTKKEQKEHDRIAGVVRDFKKQQR